MPQAALNPEKLLSELRDLWVSLGESESDSGGVLRACSMTLVVAAEDEEDARKASETLAELMPEHPSRAVVLRFDADHDDTLEARVFAQCWMPFGRRQQICCEQIEITAGSAQMGSVPGVVLSIAAPDLPVVLWYRGPRWMSAEAAAGLFPIAGKVIVDSAASADPEGALRILDGFRASRIRIADLAWTRLTGWRETVARIFASPEERHRCAAVETIRMEYRGEVPSTGAWYLAAWMRSAFPNAVTHLEASPANRNCILIGGQACQEVSIESPDGVGAEIRVDGRSFHTMFSPDSEKQLMHEELSILTADEVFEAVLPAAAAMAAGGGVA